MDNEKRDKYLRKNYGITLKQYNQMLKKQRQRCAVCEKHKSEERRSLAVDHCHETGIVRGLLCYYCNKHIIGRIAKKHAKNVVAYLVNAYKMEKKNVDK